MLTPVVTLCSQSTGRLSLLLKPKLVPRVVKAVAVLVVPAIAIAPTLMLHQVTAVSQVMGSPVLGQCPKAKEASPVANPRLTCILAVIPLHHLVHLMSPMSVCLVQALHSQVEEEAKVVVVMSAPSMAPVVTSGLSAV